MAGKLVAASCRCECWLLLRGCVCRWAAARPASWCPLCASLRLGVVDLEARPGPAAAHRHRGQAPLRGALYARACGSESSISKPGQALRPSGTLHTGGAFHCCTHPIQAPPPTGTAAKPHSQASLVPQLTRRPPHRRCLVYWWVIGVALKVGQAPPLPPGTAVGHQPGAVCPALVSNLARSGGLQHEDLAGGVSPTCRVLV